MAVYLIVYLVLSQSIYTIAEKNIFFHAQSRIVLEPDVKSAKGFGSSLSFFNRSLLVGAPHANLNGAVYACPLEVVPESNSIKCSDNGINLNDYCNEFDRSLYPNISFCFGTSLAVTESYFVSCAPLWAGALKQPSFLKGPFGTCFASTEYKHTKTNRLLEHYEKSLNSKLMDVPTNLDVYGTFGWSTLVDEVNKIIVFAKPASNQGLSRLSYLPIDNPMAYPKLVKDIDQDLLVLYNYKGRALTSGVFFKNHDSLIAFSMENDRRRGAIGFLSYNTISDILSVVKDPKTGKPLLYKQSTVGLMFGSALHATDIDQDKYSDLFVGAPGQACWLGSYEVGAVYVYMGGEATSKTNVPHICGKKDGSRFGTAIASADLDNDNIPELFVSAPYESSGEGVVYVIPGREIKERLVIKKENLVIDNLRTQEIKVSEFEAFGFSLHVIPAFDQTQLNALAVGSPHSERVVIYRSIPSINVTVNIVDEQVVRESHENFTVPLKIGIEYPKSINITAKILLRVSLASNMFAEIYGDSEYELDISNRQPIYLQNIVVKMNDHDLHTYKFKAEVKTKEFKEVYDGSIVRLSSYSKPEIVHDIKRTCDDDVCRPRLSATFRWSGRETYVLGSSQEEKMSVNVLNDGNSSDYSCAWIHVTGAPVALLECDQPEDFWYKCDLIIERHEQRSLDIRLNMKKMISTDEKLRVEVLLYNNCPMTRVKSDYEAKIKEISYTLNPNDININVSTSDRIMTESKLSLENTTIDMHSSFTITNEGTVLWKSVQVQLIASGRHIQHFKETSTDLSCHLDTIQNFTYNCNLDLKPNSIVRIETITKLTKDETVDQLLKFGTFKTTTSLILKFSDVLDSINKTLTTAFSYQNDKTFAQNETYIIIASVVGAAIFLALVVYALYRGGFFRRVKKKELEHMRSIKRPASSGTTSGTSRRGSEIIRTSATLPVNNDCTELEVIDDTEDILMQDMQNVDSDTRDESVLIEKRK